jgi:hypothetical protein
MKTQRVDTEDYELRFLRYIPIITCMSIFTQVSSN